MNEGYKAVRRNKLYKFRRIFAAVQGNDNDAHWRCARRSRRGNEAKRQGRCKVYFQALPNLRFLKNSLIRLPHFSPSTSETT